MSNELDTSLQSAVKVESTDSAFAVKPLSYKKHSSLNSFKPKSQLLENIGERVVMVNPNDDLTPTDLLKRFGVIHRDSSMFPNRADAPTFGDFSSFKDFGERAGLYSECQNQFYGLPSEVRDRFDNDLGKFAAYVNQSDFNIEHLMTDDFKNNVYYPHLQQQKYEADMLKEKEENLEK